MCTTLPRLLEIVWAQAMPGREVAERNEALRLALRSARQARR
jgi:hypothetical protein